MTPKLLLLFHLLRGDYVPFIEARADYPTVLPGGGQQQRLRDALRTYRDL
jgi:hypothetical protein